MSVDFWDSGRGITAFIVIMVLAIGLVIGGLGWLIGTAQCNNINTITGRYTEFHLIGGCFVEVDGGLVPLDVWREFGE